VRAYNIDNWIEDGLIEPVFTTTLIKPGSNPTTDDFAESRTRVVEDNSNKQREERFESEYVTDPNSTVQQDDSNPRNRDTESSSRQDQDSRWHGDGPQSENVSNNGDFNGRIGGNWEYEPTAGRYDTYPGPRGRDQQGHQYTDYNRHENSENGSVDRQESEAINNRPHHRDTTRPDRGWQDTRHPHVGRPDQFQSHRDRREPDHLYDDTCDGRTCQFGPRRHWDDDRNPNHDYNMPRRASKERRERDMYETQEVLTTLSVSHNKYRYLTIIPPLW
jgi:hypothetical protein